MTRPEGLAASCALGQVFAVRHGQSTANVAFAEAARTGSIDLPLAGTDAAVPLSVGGVQQAQALGQWLAALPPGHRPGRVVCSTYLRARQTWSVMAETAAALGHVPPPLLVDERLRDREMGIFELHTPEVILDRAPQEAERRARVGEWAYRPPGGESLADVALRVRDLFAELNAAAVGQRVLLVAHDAVVVALRYVIAGIGAARPDGTTLVPNASVSTWTGDGTRLHLARFGDTTHLNHLEVPA
ncbi:MULTISPECIES: histidine phosphatase family protein [Streptomyces]|uniref:histidine phosphatase family protein n=1 Tax=Streptomyces TaxID=1883 RepID=UPI0027DBE7DF|nr:histidine phosphatase family protein [Streptomyces fildesensis]